MNTKKGPRIFADPKTQTYESQLRFAAEQAMEGRPPTKLPCSVTIQARVAIPTTWSKAKQEAARCGQYHVVTRPDCNNYSKIFDACNGVVWEDDRQIYRELVHKVYSDTPGLAIIVVAAEQWAPPPRPESKRMAKAAKRAATTSDLLAVAS